MALRWGRADLDWILGRSSLLWGWWDAGKNIVQSSCWWALSGSVLWNCLTSVGMAYMFTSLRVFPWSGWVQHSLGLYLQRRILYVQWEFSHPAGDGWERIGCSWPCLASQCMSAVCLNEESLYFFHPLPKGGFFLQGQHGALRSVLISDLLEDSRIKK